ncbi:unnamed protein product [Victoria cruziana]
MTVPDARKDLLMVNMGPHHLSMRSVLRLIVTLDGEDVINCEPILGYLHRGMEKITENRTIIQYLPYVIRWDYLATMFMEAIAINAPEELGNIQVPKRASYIRIIMLELSRIASHLLWLGPFMADIDKCLDFCNYFLMGVVEYQKLITRNPIFLERVKGCYDEFDWKVQWQKEGDSLARYLVRIGKMMEYIKINSDFKYKFISKNPSPSFELSKQELYVRVEAPKGELGIFLIGDNSIFPWRWKIHPLGFINLQILPQLVKRMKLADIITILGSIDIIMGEVDR